MSSTVHVVIAVIAAFFSGGMFFHGLYMRDRTNLLVCFPAATTCAVYFAARSQGWAP